MIVGRPKDTGKVTTFSEYPTRNTLTLSEFLYEIERFGQVAGEVISIEMKVHNTRLNQIQGFRWENDGT